jgi:hypothetical protein
MLYRTDISNVAWKMKRVKYGRQVPAGAPAGTGSCASAAGSGGTGFGKGQTISEKTTKISRAASSSKSVHTLFKNFIYFTVFLEMLKKASFTKRCQSPLERVWALYP